MKFAAGFIAVISLAFLFAVVTPLRAAAIHVFGIVSCASTSACTGGANTSTGPGVQGASAQGNGVVGQTRFNSIKGGATGVRGQDLSLTGNANSGVAGVSTRGYGVFGSSSSGVAILGRASSGTGVAGLSATYDGVAGSGVEGVIGSDQGGPSNDALFANGNGGDLIRALNLRGKEVYFLQDDGTATFINPNTIDGTGYVAMRGEVVAGSSAVAKGAYGYFTSGKFGSNAVVGEFQGTSCLSCAGVQGNNNSTPRSVAVYANGFGGLLFEGWDQHLNNSFTVDDAGNVHAHSFTADLSSTQTTSTGSRLTTYAPETRSPIIEDSGEAALVGGQAYVHLDNAFAAAIDHSRPYLVFLTPEGSVGGTLYVSQKTPSGFAVRETVAAHSNVGFDYRIVARPFARPIVPSIPSHGTKKMPFIRQSVSISRTRSH